MSSKLRLTPVYLGSHVTLCCGYSEMKVSKDIRERKNTLSIRLIQVFLKNRLYHTNAANEAAETTTDGKPKEKQNPSYKATSLTFNPWVNMTLLHTAGIVVTITTERSLGSGMNSVVLKALETSG